jgi:hypothetical protein
MSMSKSPVLQINEQIKGSLVDMLGAREFRVVGMQKHDAGWTADVEVHVRNPQLSIANSAGSKDMLTRCRYRVDFDTELQLCGFTETEFDS